MAKIDFTNTRWQLHLAQVSDRVDIRSKTFIHDFLTILEAMEFDEGVAPPDSVSILCHHFEYELTWYLKGRPDCYLQLLFLCDNTVQQYWKTENGNDASGGFVECFYVGPKLHINEVRSAHQLATLVENVNKYGQRL